MAALSHRNLHPLRHPALAMVLVTLMKKHTVSSIKTETGKLVAGCVTFTENNINTVYKHPLYVL